MPLAQSQNPTLQNPALLQQPASAPGLGTAFSQAPWQTPGVSNNVPAGSVTVNPGQNNPYANSSAPGSTSTAINYGSTPYIATPGGSEIQPGQAPQQIGNYQLGTEQGSETQAANQRYSINADPNYQNYAQSSLQASQLGQAAGQYLNTPGVTAGLGAMQGTLGQNAGTTAGIGMLGSAGGAMGAMGPSSAQTGSLGLLGQTAAGQGPNVAGMQSQQAVSQAERSQLSAAASARGGAYAQSAAQSQAGQNAAQIESGAAGTAAQTAAQQQLGAEGQYSQAALGNAQQSLAALQGQAQAGQALAQAGTQSQAGQTAAAQGYEQAQAGQQQAALGYYQSQQQAAQAQAGLAGQLASSQIANDYGLAGTQLQTQTQQNIASQQQNTQLAGAGVGAAGALLALLSTGGAAAGARGAADAGAPSDLAAKIGAHVGHAIGRMRGGPSLPAPVWQGAERADTEAAKVAAAGGLTHADLGDMLAQLRAPTRSPASRQAVSRPAPVPALHTGEPLERQAYLTGRGLAQQLAAG